MPPTLPPLPKLRKLRGDRVAKMRPPEALAPQHERFCQSIADGSTAVEAYRRNVAEEGTKYMDCARAALELMKLPEIAERVRQLRTSLREVMEQKHGIKAEQIASFLLEIINTPADQIESGSRLINGVVPGKFGEKIEVPDKIAAVARLNKMLGYEVEKSEVVLSTHEVVSDVLEKLYGGPGKG